MNCVEARAAYLAGDQDEATSRHFDECAACRSQRDGLDTGRRLLADPTTWEEPSPELEQQVVALVSGRATGSTASSTPLQRWIRPLSVAAAAVVIAGLVVLLRPTPPDWEVSMPGTALAADATSTVAGWNEASGTRMVVTIDGLEPAPPGYFYEFWLSEGPVHISAGTFTAGGEIELWTGVSRAEFPRLWVTLEPVDEDESPTEHTVLDTGD